MMVGYARVSTHDKNPALQIDALHVASCDCIFADNISGAVQSRPKLDEALRVLKRGDTFVVWKLDRLGRNLRHLIALISELERRGIGFKSLSEGIDTQTAAGRLLFHVLGASAEFERALISDHTRAGIAAARVRGRCVTIKAAAANGYGFNPLALLTPSDIDLIQKTTGILFKDGKPYHSDGTLVSNACDSEGNLIDADVPNATAAGKLAQSLADMRFAGLTDSSLPYAGSEAITADDIRAYIKMYDDANAPLPSKAILLRAADVLDATFSAKAPGSTA